MTSRWGCSLWATTSLHQDESSRQVLADQHHPTLRSRRWYLAWRPFRRLPAKKSWWWHIWYPEKATTSLLIWCTMAILERKESKEHGALSTWKEEDNQIILSTSLNMLSAKNGHSRPQAGKDVSRTPKVPFKSTDVERKLGFPRSCRNNQILKTHPPTL